MEGFQPVIPYLKLSNAAAAIDFYKAAFGAEERNRSLLPGTDKIMHLHLTINGGIVMGSDDFSSEMGGKDETPTALGGSSVVLHLQMGPEIDSFFERAVAAGATVTMPLADQFWGDRYGQVQDPFGHRWAMGWTKTQLTPGEQREAAKDFKI